MRIVHDPAIGFTLFFYFSHAAHTSCKSHSKIHFTPWVDLCSSCNSPARRLHLLHVQKSKLGSSTHERRQRCQRSIILILINGGILESSEEREMSWNYMAIIGAARAHRIVVQGINAVWPLALSKKRRETNSGHAQEGPKSRGLDHYSTIAPLWNIGHTKRAAFACGRARRW